MVEDTGVPFEVIEGEDIGDWSGVREQRFVLPPQNNLKLRIHKVSIGLSKDKMTKNLEVSFRIVDGVPIKDENGNDVMKYIGMSIPNFPVRLAYWVSPEKLKMVADGVGFKESTKNWYKNQQYIVQTKYLLTACGISPDFKDYRRPDGKVDMERLITDLTGQEVLANVTQKEETAVSQVDGQRRGVGTFVNEIKNFKKVV